jgi:hypothetical protein
MTTTELFLECSSCRLPVHGRNGGRIAVDPDDVAVYHRSCDRTLIVTAGFRSTASARRRTCWGARRTC